jgi:hypothetical protein
MSNPSGLCLCGCGRSTPNAKWANKAQGLKKGEPTHYLPGHHGRRSPVDYIVDENGCWVWQLSQQSTGYGKITLSGPNGKRRVAAHRVFFERAKGPIPEGLQLDHLCRNRLCVNPDHLEPVTQMENFRRSIAGRFTELSANDVLLIRASSASSRSLASEFGVCGRTIQRIRARERYAHVQDLPLTGESSESALTSRPRISPAGPAPETQGSDGAGLSGHHATTEEQAA